jgi:hypothetical protein
MVENPQVEPSVVNVAKSKHGSLLILRNDVSFDVLSNNCHVPDAINLFHELQVIVINVKELIAFLAKHYSLIMLVDNRNSNDEHLVSFHEMAQRQIIEDSAVWLEMVVNLRIVVVRD